MRDELIHKLLNIVAFVSQMESEGGIKDKTPDEILAMFNKYCKSDEFIKNFKEDLSDEAKEKVRKWANTWLTEEQREIARHSKWKNTKRLHPSPGMFSPGLASIYGEGSYATSVLPTDPQQIYREGISDELLEIIDQFNVELIPDKVKKEGGDDG